MKIAILCPGYGWVRRGVERVAEELAHRLGEGCQPAVYSLWRNSSANGSQERSNGAKIRKVPGIPRTHPLARLYSPLARRAGVYLWGPGDFEALTYAAGLLPRLLQDRPDLVLNFAGPAVGRVCKMLRLIRKTPFLHSAQGMAQGRLEWIHACQRPNRYLALSLPNQEWVEARAPWVRTELVPNGVDCSLFSPHGESASLPLAPPVVLFVGAMDPVKRPELAVRAVARWSADGAAHRARPSLLMIGEGRIRPEIETLGKELLGERFLLLPSVANEELPRYYRACSVFTLPSPAEPFGIVFLEAMACGRPVAAHQGAVQKWLLGEAGVCCNCEEVEEYAAALKRALESDFGDRPRRRALEFDWGRIIAKYENVFCQVAAEKRQ